METIKLLGEGTYRLCYKASDSNFCIKKVKSRIQKEYFGIKFNLNMEKYLKLKFGISDMNRLEYEQIENLPKSIKQYVPSDVKLSNKHLIMARPKDYTGEYSRNLIEFGKVKNQYFWNCIEEICLVFEKNNLWYHDVFFKGNNLLVQKISKDKFQPVMIDLKDIGNLLSPIQLNLILKSEQKKKFYRRFHRFKSTYYLE